MYRSKGSVRGHEIFFRLLFGETSETIYPREQMLRASDGKFDSLKVLRVISTIGDANSLTGRIITGQTSNATAIVESSTQFQIGDKTITQIDGTGYTYTASGTANATTSGGGLDVTATQNLEYDLINPYIETLTPQNTSVSAQIKQTTAKSYAGSETAYVKDTSYLDIVIKQSNYLEAPRKVTHRVKGAKSAQVKLSLSTSNNFVSPIVDLQRSSLILIGNKIDKQSQYAAGAGFNIPIDYVDETDKNSGSHLSKHITKPISLLTDAVGLKVLLSANRPSVADFDLYYKTISEDQILSTIKWNLATKEALVPSDENRSVFREYRYLIGGDGGTLVPFTTFQLKIVFKSTNSSKVPIIKDLRAIALGV